MNPTLVIENARRRPDAFYLIFLAFFWLIWTPLTGFAQYFAITDFHWFFVIWLPFGYIGVLGIPWMVIQSLKPQKLEATPDALRIHGSGVPFRRVVDLPRDREIKLHIGHAEEDSEGEMVATLNLLSDASWYQRRIMISPLSHPEEKPRLFRLIKSFLCENGFEVVIEDKHPKTRTSEDDEK